MSDNFEEVSSLEFTVGSVKSAGSGYTPLDEDEVYEARLVKVEQKALQFGPALEWVFDLLDPKFSYEYEGKTVQRRVKGTTSLACNPKSKLYAWYCKLLGKELPEGGRVQLASIVGRNCRLLVVNKPSKKINEDGTKTIYSNVAKVLTAKNVKEEVTESVKVEEAVTEYVETATAKAEEVKPKKPVEKAKAVVEPPKVDEDDDDDVFSDIF